VSATFRPVVPPVFSTTSSSRYQDSPHFPARAGWLPAVLERRLAEARQYHFGDPFFLVHSPEKFTGACYHIPWNGPILVKRFYPQGSENLSYNFIPLNFRARYLFRAAKVRICGFSNLSFLRFSSPFLKSIAPFRWLLKPLFVRAISFD